MRSRSSSTTQFPGKRMTNVRLCRENLISLQGNALIFQPLLSYQVPFVRQRPKLLMQRQTEIFQPLPRLRLPLMQQGDDWNKPWKRRVCRTRILKKRRRKRNLSSSPLEQNLRQRYRPSRLRSKNQFPPKISRLLLPCRGLSIASKSYASSFLRFQSLRPRYQQ